MNSSDIDKAEFKRLIRERKKQKTKDDTVRLVLTILFGLLVAAVVYSPFGKRLLEWVKAALPLSSSLLVYLGVKGWKGSSAGGEIYAEQQEQIRELRKKLDSYEQQSPELVITEMYPHFDTFVRPADTSPFDYVNSVWKPITGRSLTYSRPTELVSTRKHGTISREGFERSHILTVRNEGTEKAKNIQIAIPEMADLRVLFDVPDLTAGEEHPVLEAEYYDGARELDLGSFIEYLRLYDQHAFETVNDKQDILFVGKTGQRVIPVTVTYTDRFENTYRNEYHLVYYRTPNTRKQHKFSPSTREKRDKNGNLVGPAGTPTQPPNFRSRSVREAELKRERDATEGKQESGQPSELEATEEST